MYVTGAVRFGQVWAGLGQEVIKKIDPCKTGAATKTECLFKQGQGKIKEDLRGK